MWTCWDSTVVEVTPQNQLVVNYSCPERPEMVIGILISLPDDLSLATTDWIETQMEIYSAEAISHWEMADANDALIAAQDTTAFDAIKSVTKMGMAPAMPMDT